jgi:hypothetical protein
VKLLKVERLDPLPNGLVGAQSTWESRSSAKVRSTGLRGRIDQPTLL